MTTTWLFTKYFDSIKQFEGFNFIFPKNPPPKAYSASYFLQLPPPPLPPPGVAPAAQPPPVATAVRWT